MATSNADHALTAEYCLEMEYTLHRISFTSEGGAGKIKKPLKEVVYQDSEKPIFESPTQRVF